MLRKYFLQTFGCQMNQADSEKVHMLLLQSGFVRCEEMSYADLVIFNTCSVRQKGEDRVFGMLHEIEKLNETREKKIIAGITGCMVRKTGLAKRYIERYININPSHTKPHPNPLLKERGQTTSIQKAAASFLLEEKIEGGFMGKRGINIQRNKATKIELLGENSQGFYNFDDDLFRRTSILDFTLRIEELKFLPLMLTEIYGEKVGQEDKFDDYLKQAQQRENPFSASVIIQTGCDNYCTFCIVPYTRGGEVSRNKEDILHECREAVASGAKEITLLGQNVNSYGKQKNIKLWNAEKSKWDNEKSSLKIGIDLDETLFIVLCQEILDEFNLIHKEILNISDILTYNLNGDIRLEKIYKNYEEKNRESLPLQPGAYEVILKLKEAGHQLYIITSREIEHKQKSISYLSRLFGNDFFSDIIFVRENYEDKKYKAANALGLDIVIDDGDHHIDGYKENYTGKIVIFSQKWNERFSEDNTQTFRIHDWYEFENILPKLTFQSPFRELLREIDSIPGLERIRFTSSNPHDMTRDILDAHFDLKHTCNYLHFALQSGSNEMLKRMNRRHSYEDFRDMVKYLRNRDPLFSISTDIIVGFSGETDMMFEETVKAFEECVFDFSYTARYSVRPQTLAARMYPDDVPDRVKAERWNILNELLLKNLQKRNELMLGRVEEVLISGEKDEQFFGRTRNFKEVFFEKVPEIQIGQTVHVLITGMQRYILLGKII